MYIIIILTLTSHTFFKLSKNHNKLFKFQLSVGITAFEAINQVYTLVDVCMHVVIIQAQLLHSTCMPLSPVPLPQWSSAGVLLVHLQTSLAIESSMAMDKAYLFLHM